MDKTNLIARPSKVILAGRGRASAKLQSSNTGENQSDRKEAYLEVQASSKWGLVGNSGRIPAIPHSWATLLIHRGHTICYWPERGFGD